MSRRRERRTVREELFLFRQESSGKGEGTSKEYFLLFSNVRLFRERIVSFTGIELQ